ncbi:MAG: GntR family transcriptional regulator [Micromonosporaceae bacterium]
MADQLADRAYRRLRQEIVQLALPPGSAVSEAQLAARYDLGKAAIRGALARLRHERLVTAVPRQGHRVTDVTIADVEEIFDLRLSLEILAARRACGRADAARLRGLDAVCAAYQPNDPGSRTEFLTANRQFHLAVAQASGNQRLVDILATLLHHAERAQHIGLAHGGFGDTLTHQHAELVEALAADQPDAAEQWVRQALEGFRDQLIAHLRNAVRTAPLSAR